MKAGSQRGFISPYVPTIDGKVVACSHWHRTASGAEKCAKETVRFLEKVERLKNARNKSSKL